MCGSDPAFWPPQEPVIGLPYAVVSPPYIAYTRGANDGFFAVTNKHPNRKLFCVTVPLGDRPFSAHPVCAIINSGEKLVVSVRLCPQWAADHPPATWSALAWVSVTTAIAPKSEKVHITGTDVPIGSTWSKMAMRSTCYISCVHVNGPHPVGDS